MSAASVKRAKRDPGWSKRCLFDSSPADQRHRNGLTVNVVGRVRIASRDIGHHLAIAHRIVGKGRRRVIELALMTGLA
jgi:hypothetical protein